MKIETIDDTNEADALSFIQSQKKDDYNSDDWQSNIDNALIKLIGYNDETPESTVLFVLLLDDYPKLKLQGVPISRSKWVLQLSQYFVFPCDEASVLWVSHLITEPQLINTAQLFATATILPSIFATYPDIKAVLSTTNDISDAFSSLAKKSETVDFDIYICQRYSIMPTISVRQATVEDFDQLMPLLTTNSTIDLQKEHGQFFLADMIEQTHKSDKTISLIAEVGDKIVGFACFNTSVDINEIQTSFDISHFDNMIEFGDAKISEQIDDETIASNDETKTTFDSISVDCTAEVIETTDHKIIDLNLICINPKYGAAANNLIRSAFAYFPNKNYLIACIPHTQPLPFYLHSFTRVYPLPGSNYPDEIYATHRNTIHSQISIKKASVRDLEIITDIIPNGDAIYLKNCTTYIGCVDQKIIAVISVKNIIPSNLRKFRQCFNFNVYTSDRYSTDNCIEANYCYTNPLFHHQNKDFLREVLRLNDARALLYRHNNVETSDIVDPKPLPTIVSESFQQLRAHNICGNTSANHSLHIYSKHFFASPMQTLHNRIVVIGSSNAAIGCIEYLLTNTDFMFPNITLIDPFHKNDNNDGTIIDDSLSKYSLKSLDMTAKIERIFESVTDIDCNNECVVLSDGNVYSYDALIIATGLSGAPIIPPSNYYQTKITLPILSELYSNLGNVSIMNVNRLQLSDDFANNATAENPIVIYGDYICGLSVINQLLSIKNINANAIVLIGEISNCSQFVNAQIWDIIKGSLSQLGIRVLEGTTAIGLNVNNDDNIVDKMHLQTPFDTAQLSNNAVIIPKPIPVTERTQSITEDGNGDQQSNDEPTDEALPREIDYSTEIPLNEDDCCDGKQCLALHCSEVLLCQRQLNIEMLNATNQPCFVVNGTMIVNNRFQTVNTNIYAIGSVANFSNQCHSDIPLQCANGFTIGATAAQCIINEILGDDNRNSVEIKNIFKYPNFNHSILPDGRHYFHAFNPDSILSDNKSDLNRIVSKNGNNSVIGCVSIDNLGYLRELVYIGNEWNDGWIALHKLINLHKSFLNNVDTKLKNNEIKNICQFFDTKAFSVLTDNRFIEWLDSDEAINSKFESLNEIQKVISNIVEQ